MKKINARINDNTEEFLNTFFKTKSSGAEYILDAMPGFYKRALHDIKDLFSDNELKAMIDTFNGTMLTPNLAGQHLHFGLVDSIELDGLDKKWDLDTESFLDKTRSLKPFESAMLEIWISGYWNNAGDIDEYIKTMR